MKTLFILFSFFLFHPSLSYSGACDPTNEAGNDRKIDGPANVRQAPNSRSKILASLPNLSVVRIVASEFVKTPEKAGAYWYKINWKSESKSQAGWTHEQNIICD